MPWKLVEQLPDWRVDWAYTGRGGVCVWHERRIVIDPDMPAAVERSVVAHEAIHALRGPFPQWQLRREEEVVSQAAARYLIPLGRLVEAVVWSMDPHEVADELWVDVATLEARVRGLYPAERAALARRLDQPA